MDGATIAAQALLHPPSVTRILHGLECRKLIVRHADSNDGRRQILKLSPEGEVILQKTAKPALIIMKQIADAFGIEKLHELIAELSLLEETIRISAPMNHAEFN
jgi:DNA-binding MarR family transcriptional regulator